MQVFKFSTRAAIVLGTLALLAACGGGGGSTPAPTPTPPPPPPAPVPTFKLGGSIYSLGNAKGLTLVNGSETLVIPANAYDFTFATQVAQNSSYNVQIGSQPAGLRCTVYKGSGTVTSGAMESVRVDCLLPLDATPYTVSTFAGDDGQTLVDGIGAAARFAAPYAIAKDSQGNFYVSDTGNNSIRRVTPWGAVSTLARVDSRPTGLALDTSDNLYVADALKHRILKIAPNGVVNTLAGSSSGESGYVDGAASAARFSYPSGLAADAAGNVYVFDGWGESLSASNPRIRKISPSGVVSTLAGGGGGQGFVDGTGAAARFSSTGQLAVDGAGNVYVADTFNKAIRKVTPSGLVSTVFGGPIAPGTESGAGSATQLGSVEALALDSAGNIYVADRDKHSVRKITPAGVMSTVAGAGPYGNGGLYGFADGTGAAVRFSSPTGIVVDAAGNLQVVDAGNRAIRTVTPVGGVTTLAGQGPTTGVIDGVGTAARFGAPTDIAADGVGNVYVVDRNLSAAVVGYPIRKITSSGVVTTLADTGTLGQGLAADSAGNLYVLDVSGEVERISANGVRTDFPQLGSGVAGLAVDAEGALYMTSRGTVIRMAPSGFVTTLAGDGNPGFVDGLGPAARFNWPVGLAVDHSGNVYVADRVNHAIRKISPQGQVTTLASGGFTAPSAITVDSTGTVYFIASVQSYYIRPVTYYWGGAIFRIDGRSGALTRIAGGGSGHADGPGATATFDYPTGIAVDGAGNVYVADSQNRSVRKITVAK
jgi:sugar lactone lactonase YvrE